MIQHVAQTARGEQIARIVEPAVAFEAVAPVVDAVLRDLVACAAQCSATPFAVLHVVGETPAWYVAGTTSELPADPLRWPGISEALQSRRITWAANTANRSRFAAHPLVVSGPKLRSVAAVPLIAAGGNTIGVLGVFDTAERPSSEMSNDALEALARSVVGYLALRGQVHTLETQVTALAATCVGTNDRHRVLDGILEHTDALIYAKDLDGRFVFLNPALTDSFAFPPDMLGRTDHDLFPTEQADYFRRNDQRIIRTGSGEVFEEVLTQAEGAVHTYRSTKFPLRDEAGVIYAVAGVSVDVSELTTARQAHQEAEQRWHALIEHSAVAVALVTRGGTFRYVNRQAAALLGAQNPGSLIGRTVGEFLPARVDPAALADGWDAVLDGAPPILSRRAVLVTIAGTPVTVEFSAAAIVDRGEPVVQVEIRDVTTAAAAEEKLQASERRFRAVFDNSPVAMGITDENDRFVDTNAAMDQLLGAGRGDLLGKVGLDFADPADRPLVEAARGRQPEPDGALTGVEARFIRRDGARRWAWVAMTAAPGLGGEKWVLAIAKDVTDRKAAQIALLESQADLAAVAAVARCVQSGEDPRPLVVESIRRLAGADSVVLTEALDDHTLVVTSSAGTNIVGVRVPLQDVSMTAQVWRTGERVFLADVAANSTVNRALLTANTATSSLWQPVIVRGEVQAVVGVGWRHRIDNPGDRAVRVVQVIADEAGTSLQATRLRRELEQLASTDPLTGSLNRRAWATALQRLTELAQLSGEPLAVAMLDLDHFKAYNDRHGHMAGDSLLAEYALAARSCLRKGDVFARWGGEEFVVALPDCSSAEATIILDRIRAAVPAGLTCSIGHTTWIPGESIDTCIGRADAALYSAKAAGRNQLITR